MAGINVVPYVDVMLVLLVIFMISTPLMYSQIEVELPHLASEPTHHPAEIEPVVITIDSQQRLYMRTPLLEEKVYSADDLLHTLVALQVRAETHHVGNLPLYVRADKQVSYQQVLELLNLLKTAGFHTVGLMAEIDG